MSIKSYLIYTPPLASIKKKYIYFCIITNIYSKFLIFQGEKRYLFEKLKKLGTILKKKLLFKNMIT